MHLSSIFTVAVVGMTACATPGAQAPAELAAPAASAPEVERGTPAGRLRHLLLARHPEDLPSREVLERIDGAPELLRQIGTTDEELVVRARALDLLGIYDTPENVAFLVATARDGAVPAKLRAAALLGLKRLDLAAHADLRALFVELARGSDPRLAIEAATVIQEAPALAAERAALIADVAVPAFVKQRLGTP